MDNSLNEIDKRLEEAIIFINGPPNRDDAKMRLQWIDVLTRDLITLDNMSRSQMKSDLIRAIQHILEQLDHLFDDKKPPILLSNTISKRDNYLPENKNSLYALGNAYSS